MPTDGKENPVGDGWLPRRRAQRYDPAAGCCIPGASNTSPRPAESLSSGAFF